MPLEALLTAEEAFLTSSTREVVAIAAVDERRLAAPGARTRALAEAFEHAGGVESGSVSDRRCTTSPTATTTGTAPAGVTTSRPDASTSVATPSMAPDPSSTRTVRPIVDNAAR